MEFSNKINYRIEPLKAKEVEALGIPGSGDKRWDKTKTFAMYLFKKALDFLGVFLHLSPTVAGDLLSA